ncbi:TonB-dependent receptor [Nibribacter ruber]|uniref:TonB-dependent receptor n=1 Tax=Nibribacter ruber TaxID=2698458 RepID=A0A6P1P476_9BACT|nr:TonB-dependent receptor [Nibribacter ruber]QHL89193.1 TonB-dependent receptor [Nibribacter ruber]
MANTSVKAEVLARPHGWQQAQVVLLTGTVVDKGTQQPVEFATIALQTPSGKVLSGTSADARGKFTFPKVAAGSYQLVVTYLGYAPLTHAFTVSAEATALDVGTLSLSAADQTMKEVVVSAEKDLIQDTDDGLVYNAEKDITNIGGTAADVLKKVPMLSVDIDGNVEMRGSSKIKVLINNKPSSMMAANLAEALQQIPADMIKSVEVITNPSAKHDAEGSAGVINIVTKSTLMQGMTGAVNASVGNRTSNLNASLNGRKGKTGIRASAGGNLNNRHGDSETEQLYLRDKLSTSGDLYTENREIEQASRFDNQDQSGFLQLGGDHDFNDKNNLSANLRLNKSFSDNERVLTSEENNYTTQFQRQFQRDILTEGRNQSLEANLDYTRRFQKKGQELEVLGLYSTNRNNSQNHLTQLEEATTVNYREEADNLVANKEATVQADYTHPFEKWGKLEVGTKAILRQSESNHQLFSASTAEGPLDPNPRRSNIFQYDQNVYSTYFSYTLRVQSKYVMRLGARYEYTHVAGDFISTQNSIEKTFKNLMPNVTLSRTFEQGKRLRLSYSTRIHRPQIQLLNPYIDSTNVYNIRYGNPDLDAELTHNTEVNYTHPIKTTTVNASVYWRQTNNDIGAFQFEELVTRNGEQIIRRNTTQRNIGRNAVYGLSLSTTTRFKQKGQVGVNGNLYYTSLQSNALQKTSAGWMYSLNSNASYRFLETYSVQVSGSFNSRKFDLQSRSTASYSYSLGLRKEFWDKKAGLSLNIENFIGGNLTTRNSVYTETYVQDLLNRYHSNSWQNNYNRVVRLSFNYKFGKMEFKPGQEKKGIVNEDKEKAGEIQVTDPKAPATGKTRRSNSKKKQ